jgi:hypothetical protein
MTSPAATPPEAQGPGDYQPDGRVVYGDAAAAGAQAVIIPAMPAWQRDANMAAYRDRCTRCAEVPDEVIAAWRQALADVKAGRLR